ncbi:GTP-binding protein gtr1 [Trapelia coarctata]|nr:GTP-binding protein gtr1 [Trapelia coarctata]
MAGNGQSREHWTELFTSRCFPRRRRGSVAASSISADHLVHQPSDPSVDPPVDPSVNTSVDTSDSSSTDGTPDEMDPSKLKEQKQKVLLMGKSGSGKSSMRNIIFSNFVAKDVRRLGATIDVEHSRVKFLGNLVLNLWDCGGQDAFTENFLTSQKSYVFSEVGVLIYVFDIESREFERDLMTYNAVVKALEEFSPHAKVFCLVHKMDLVQKDFREGLLQERHNAIKEKSEKFAGTVASFATTIWDQSLYKAWGNIVHSMIPNLDIIEEYLRELAEAIDAEEVILFEATTFLTVTSVTSEIGQQNPFADRFERLSNIIKNFKHSLANFTSSSSSSPQFQEFQISTAKFNLIIDKLTSNTYVMAILPPGEGELNCARTNVAIAREEFTRDVTSLRAQAM